MSNCKLASKISQEANLPFKCPIENCTKTFTSFTGAKIHAHKAHNQKTKRFGKKNSKNSPDTSVTELSQTSQFAESDNMYEVLINNKPCILNISEPLLLVKEDFEDDNCDQDECSEQHLGKSRISKYVSKERNSSSNPALRTPEPSYRLLANHDSSKPPHFPPTYIKYNYDDEDEDKSDKVEYDMDDEDVAWLSIINEKRRKQSLSKVPEDLLELLIDCLEKESYTQGQSIAEETLASIDENAVCCICMDGDCDDSNAILFCDMCNLPVHQECYGVPFIPAGQWLCRRCSISPSVSVGCVLCPNKDGALKETDDKRWAHVICALWIPEVGFKNPNFLEPIDSIQNIPSARWKLRCYICKKKNVGACIQCKKSSCYTAFHVTCAQKEGLFMEMKAISANGIGDASYEIEKSAFCHLHTPKVTSTKDAISEEGDNSNDRHSESNRSSQPLTELTTSITSIPNISPKRLMGAFKSFNIPGFKQFVEAVLAYWKLKRQSRGGAPLLKRLQVTLYPKLKQEEKCSKMPIHKEELMQLVKMRQSFEKVRLLLELVKKREKLKRSLIRIKKLETNVKLQPFSHILLKTIDQLQKKDENNIFAQPVDVTLVTDYQDFVKNPMDFSTMRKKAQNYEYGNFKEFENDFNLMLENCLLYNAKDTVYYRIALEMQTQCARLLLKAKEEVIKNRLDVQNGLFCEDIMKQCVKHKNEKNNSKNLMLEPKQNETKRSLQLRETYHFLPITGISRQISFSTGGCNKASTDIGSAESDEENGIHSSIILDNSNDAFRCLKKRMKLQLTQKKQKKHSKRSKAFKSSSRCLRSSRNVLSVVCSKTKVPENFFSISNCTENFSDWCDVKKDSECEIQEHCPVPQNIPIDEVDGSSEKDSS